MIRVTLCRCGPVCPPVLVGAFYAIWADTQVRPYTNHINTTNPAIKCCNTSICMDLWSCVHCVKAKRVTMRRVTFCFLSSHASKMRSFFSFRKLGRLLFVEPLVGVAAPTPCRGGAPRAETFLSELDSEDSLLFGEPLVGVGAPTPCRGGAPRAKSFLF